MPLTPDQEIVSRSRASYSRLGERRATFLEAIAPLVGLEPNQKAYQEALYPNDPASQRAQLATRQSGCMVTLNVGLRKIRVFDPRLQLPMGERAVRGGALTLMVMEKAMAQAMGAWRLPNAKTGALPVEADLAIVGGETIGVWAKGGGFGGSHVFGVAHTEYSLSTESSLVHSYDGGQPGIHARTRALVYCGPRGDELWAASLDASGAFVFDAVDQRPVKGRRVQGWIDLDALECLPA